MSMKNTENANTTEQICLICFFCTLVLKSVNLLRVYYAMTIFSLPKIFSKGKFSPSFLIFFDTIFSLCTFSHQKTRYLCSAFEKITFQNEIIIWAFNKREKHNHLKHKGRFDMNEAVFFFSFLFQ